MMNVTTGDRSMPPLMSTMVAKAAAMPTSAMAEVMFSRLRSLKKNSLAKLRYRNSASVISGRARSGLSRNDLTRPVARAPARGAVSSAAGDAV